MAAFTELPDVVLARVLAFAAPRDLEAATVASKTVAQHILPRFPLWKALFCYRWAMLNFPLDVHDHTDSSSTSGNRDDSKTRPVPIEIDGRLRELFPSTCTESRMFQLLAHAVTPVPSYADTDATMQYRRDTWLDHTIVSLTPDAATRPERRRGKTRPLDFAFAGRFLGGDRCVRANAPFPTTFHVQVYKVRVPATGSAAASPSAHKYCVGVTASGYFEITISERARGASSHRVRGSDMTAIGLCEQRFRLIGKQPGWNSASYGYHGDDGHVFHGSGHGRPFGPSFDVGDTVGCGVRRNMRDQRSFVLFTNNGDLVPSDRGIECDHEEWFPVVGLDSANAIHVNYGQEPFRYDSAVDELFDECRGMTSLLANQLQWYAISDSDVESSDDDSDAMSNGGDTSDFVDDDSDVSEPEHVARRFLHRMLFGGDGANGDGDVFMGDPYNVVEFGAAFSDDGEFESMSDDEADGGGSGSEATASASETPSSAP